ncbi:F-box protein-like protein, partial [Tanacetum coccineum]
MDKQEGKRSRLQLEHVPELLHRTQSLLPPEEVARTCVLSKSWLHACSTIPTLRFTKSQYIDTQQQQQQEDGDDKYINLIDKTLVRYKHDNIPLQSLDLHLSIENQWSCFLLEVWVISIFSKFSCLKELSLRIRVKNIDSVRLSGALFACENLNVLSLKVDAYDHVSIFEPRVIKCLSLRVLELELVYISEEVKNLRYLRELRLKIPANQNILELDGVPSLSLIRCFSSFDHRMHPFPIHMNVLESVKELSFGGDVTNSSLLDMIKSKFPFLESLELLLGRWSDETFVITSASLKRLNLRFIDNRQIHIQVNAPKLQYFCYV